MKKRRADALLKKRRADALLVERGLAVDLAKARALVLAGAVVAGEHRVDKAGQLLAPDVTLRVKGRRDHPYASRGGVKLAHALDHFEIDPTGRVCIDLGASTGGFTDCLLQRGATRIYAVDVGYGQLDWKLQRDERVVNLERTHARDLDAAHVPEPVDMLVADISFNAIGRILAPALGLLRDGADLLLLVKPQFELPADAVGEGGIVRDPDAWDTACRTVAADVVALGCAVHGVERSPITGARGNVEFVLWATYPS